MDLGLRHPIPVRRPDRSRSPYTQPFHALELALALIASLRPVVDKIRRRSPKLAKQIEESASSVAANLGEGNRRRGKDRVHFFLMSAGSADEARCHLRVALAWRWVTEADIEKPLSLCDRELAMLWKLTN